MRIIPLFLVSCVTAVFFKVIKLSVVQIKIIRFVEVVNIELTDFNHSPVSIGRRTKIERLLIFSAH